MKGTFGCRSGCPDYTGFGAIGDRYDWVVGAYARGHYLIPASDDAVLWMEGCEPHTRNFGGTVLVTRQSGKWTVLW